MTSLLTSCHIRHVCCHYKSVACLSVRPSVTLVYCGHIGWNSSKIIPPLVSLRCSLSADPNIRGSIPRGTPGNFGPKWSTPVDLSVGDIRSQIVAERLQIAQRSQWRAYRKPPSLFRMVPSLTSYDLPSPYPNGGSICPQDTRMALYFRNWWSDTSYTSSLVLGSADRMALFLVTSNPSWRQAAILDNFECLYLRNGSFDARRHLCDCTAFLFYSVLINFCECAKYCRLHRKGALATTLTRQQPVQSRFAENPIRRNANPNPNPKP